MSRAQRKRFEIGESKEYIFRRDCYCCQICGGSIYDEGAHPQLAHKVPATIANLKKYGKHIIHHPLNLVLVDCLRCNDAANVGQNKLEEQAIIGAIRKALHNERKPA